MEGWRAWSVGPVKSLCAVLPNTSFWKVIFSLCKVIFFSSSSIPSAPSRVDGLRFRVQGAGCVQGFGEASTALSYSRLPGFGFRVQGSGFRVSGFGFRVSGFGFRVSGFGFRVSGFGFRVSDV